MRWQTCVAALAISACVWAEDKPATARQSREALEDPMSRLEGEEAVVREQLHKIGQEIDLTRSESGANQDTEKPTAKLKALNDLRNINQIRLNELMEQLRQTRREQLQTAFGQECTLTVAGPESIQIAGVSLERVLSVAGRQMLQFRSNSDGKLWTIDPQRIVTAQITR